MKPDAIWLISGGPMQVPAAKEIRRLGFALILSDRNPAAVCRSLANEFVEADTFNWQSHIEASNELAAKYCIVAVLTVAADCHYTVAKLAQSLGVHHLDPEVSQVCRNKSLTRKILTNAGIPQPWSVEVGSFKEAERIVREAQFDLVMKSTDNSGSRGLQALSKGTRLTEEQFEYTQSLGTTGQVILEERLVADPDQVSEASVETLWQGGQMFWFNWVDRIFSKDVKHFPMLKDEREVLEGIEIGHINPASHPEKVRDEVYSMMFAAGTAIGMGQQKGAHVLKGDIYFSNRGPRILELTPRSSGGWDSSGSSPARGAQPIHGLIQLALGKPLDLALWHKYFEFRYPERVCVVLSSIPKGAIDCIGRSFVLASGAYGCDFVMKDALKKRIQGDFLVPVL